MKNTSFIMLSLAFVLLVPWETANAFSAKTGSSVYVPKEDIIEGNLYAAGQNITVEGKVKGDVFCAGQTVNIRGSVDGDVICAGQTISIDANIGGNLRVAGSSIDIAGNIARNAMVFGSNIITEASSTVGWDMMVGSVLAELRGKIGRDLDGGSAQMIIDGQIGKNVKLSLDNNYKIKNSQTNKAESVLTIAKAANIGGELNYTANNEATIEKGAKINGKTIHNTPSPIKSTDHKTAYGTWVMAKIISIFSALLISLIMLTLWRKEIKTITEKMLNKIAPSIGWGFALFFLTPIAAILLIITIVGIPLAAILFVFWLLAMYIGKIIAAIMIGRSLLGKIKDENLIWSMIVGIIASWIIFSIPIIGWLLALIAMWWSIGAVSMYIRKV